jgi:capsular polysaccharide biosynthesis protein
LFAIVRAWLRLIIVGALAGAAVSLAVALITPATYVGRVTLIVTPLSTTTGITFSDIELTQALAPTFAELATTTPVLQRVIADTKVDLDTVALAKTIETHVAAGTSLIDISVTQHDPDTAAALANAIAAELEKDQTQGTNQISALRVSLTVVDPAVPPRVPEGLGIAVQTALAGAVGILLAVSLAFFVENLGRGIQSVGRSIGSARRPSPGAVDDGAWDAVDGGRRDPGFGSAAVAGERARGSFAHPMPSSSTPLSQTMVRPLAAPHAEAGPRFVITSDRAAGIVQTGAARGPLRLSPAPPAGSALKASSVDSTQPSGAGVTALNPTGGVLAPQRTAVPDPRQDPPPAARPAPAAAAPAISAPPPVVTAPVARTPSIIVPAARVATSRPAAAAPPQTAAPTPPASDPAPRPRPAPSEPRSKGAAKPRKTAPASRSTSTSRATKRAKPDDLSPPKARDA